MAHNLWRIGQAMVFYKGKRKVFMPSVLREGGMEYGARGVIGKISIANMRELSRAPQSSEQFVWLNRRYGETETQLSPSAIMPSTRADSSQNAVI